MGCYHQMGHECWNLISVESLRQYSGAILSPADNDEAGMASQISKTNRKNFEMIFDPQMYFPKSDKGCLQEWEYFPEDVETQDLSDYAWWDEVLDDLKQVVERLAVPSVCSPATRPRSYPNKYYQNVLGLAGDLQSRLKAQVVPTLLIRPVDLAEPNRAHELVSLITSYPFERVYIVFDTGVEPRTELSHVEDLAGTLSLLSNLEKAGVKTLVGYCCTDMVLWAAAGATSCATGKHFNLRRFSEGRWDTKKGGGALDYWVEDDLLAFLRQADVARARKAGIKSYSSEANPATTAILKNIEAGEPWRSESWEQYLWWFDDAFRRIGGKKKEAAFFVENAAGNWRKLRDVEVRMEVPENNGSWLRPWNQAISTLK